MKNFKLLHYAIFLVVIISVFINYSAIASLLHQYQLLDKTGHFLGFLFLTWFLDKLIKIDLKVTVFTLCIYSGLTELGQWYLAFRSGQWSDFLADVLGCITYVLIVRANRNKAKRVK
ncbi:VanZ family protein [Thalassotalea sp. ND16A]|uniref:VanZ family protein n=1 Tax=Thalassotalea sp. ND16A TaxID=1535422 RepID=UPI00136464DA|nr:VanZ family protein [Thalassotalea sp. ND16A]